MKKKDRDSFMALFPTLADDVLREALLDRLAALIDARRSHP